MLVPTTNDYQEVYNELLVHCEIHAEKREELEPLVISKVKTFFETFREYFSHCAVLPAIDYYTWYSVITGIDNPHPYHSLDIRRIAEEIYIACEMGLKFPHYHENIYRDRVKQSLLEPEPSFY